MTPLLLALALLADAQKACPCSELCVCGCNAGKACPCQVSPPAGDPLPKKAKSDCGCPCGRCDDGCTCKTGGKHCGSPNCLCVLNFGVHRDKAPPSPSYSFRDREVSKAEVMDILDGKALPDDASRLRVTVIGTPEECAPVLADLAGLPMKDKVLVTSYRPSHWAVAEAGFKTDGHPTIYVQAPTGEVLHRQDEYRGPAKLAEALRKADPSYDPKADPDLNKAPALTESLSKVPTWAWVALALGVYILLSNRK